MPRPDFFTPDPDWADYAAKHSYPCPFEPGHSSLKPIKPLALDVTDARLGQAESDDEWEAAHPLEEVGYEARMIPIKVRDETEVSVRVTFPNSARRRARGTTALPVLFVTHGGGWVQGSHLSEEAWLIWPLYERFELMVISVEYRMAPENPFPVWIEDSWDVLQHLFSPCWTTFSNLGVKLDLQRVMLAGSSSGGGISAVLSQMCRDIGIPISGVVLNVPVLCDYRHFPMRYADDDHLGSYQECVDTYSSGAMVWIWNLIHPSAHSGSHPKASPLLGNCANLPRHVIFVAGQDALRDEGIAYATKLKESGVSVELLVFNGVPHNFAPYSELRASARFRANLTAVLGRWLGYM